MSRLLYDRALHHLVTTHGRSPEEAKALMESRPVLVRVMHKRHATALEIANVLAEGMAFSDWIEKKKKMKAWEKHE